MKILIIDPFSEKFISHLHRSGYDFTYLPDSKPQEIFEIIESYHILIINSKISIDKKIISKAKNLKHILRAGIGTDHFDMAALAERDIKVKITPGANADSVAEHTIGILLALQHKLYNAWNQVQKLEWKREENRGTEIKGKTIGIIGYGHTGSAVAHRLSSFGCKIIAYDKYKTHFGDTFIQETTLAQIQKEADILSLHIPLSEETRNMINTDFLNQFQKNIVLLNLSRGEIVKTEDLLHALKTGKVIATGLDVLENEKLHTLTPLQKETYQQLFQHKNIIVTPHIAGWSQESKINIEARIFLFLTELIPDNHKINPK